MNEVQRMYGKVQTADVWELPNFLAKFKWNFAARCVHSIQIPLQRKELLSPPFKLNAQNSLTKNVLFFSLSYSDLLTLFSAFWSARLALNQCPFPSVLLTWVRGHSGAPQWAHSTPGPAGKQLYRWAWSSWWSPQWRWASNVILLQKEKVNGILHCISKGTAVCVRGWSSCQGTRKLFVLSGQVGSLEKPWGLEELRSVPVARGWVIRCSGVALAGGGPGISRGPCQPQLL